MRKSHILLFLLLACPSTYGGIDIRTPQATSSFDYVLIEDSSIAPFPYTVNRPDEDFFFNFQFNSVSAPLLMFDSSGNNEQQLVNRISGFDILSRWQLSESLTIANLMSINAVEIEGKSRLGIGDLRIQVEKSFLDYKRKWVGISVISDLIFPTGNSNLFLSNDSFGGSVKVAVEKKISWFKIAANLGYQHYGRSKFRELDFSKQLILGAGTNITMGKSFSLNLETLTSLLPHQNMEAGPGDIYLGLNYGIEDRSKFSFGFGMANVQASDQKSFRFIAGYKIYPWREKEKTPLPKSSVIVREKIIEKVINSVKRCDDERKNYIFKARELTPKEKRKFKVLPYKSSSQRKIRNIDLGMKTDIENNNPIVKDSQVMFAVDLDGVPNLMKIKKILSMKVKLSLSTRSRAKESRTGLFCLLNEKVCSGEINEHETWEKNINSQFFKGKETPNDYFLKVVKANQLPNKKTVKASVSIDLEKVLNNSLYAEDMSKILFNHQTGKQKKLYFLLADDFYISNDASLELSTLENRCKKDGE